MPAESYDANSPNAGLGLVQNSDGTSATAAIFTAAADGAQVHRIVVHSGPITSPGGTFNVAVLHDATILDEFEVTDSVDTLQYDKSFGDLLLEGGDTIKLQCRTALAAGATLHVAVYGYDYEEFLPTPVTPGGSITLDVVDNGTLLEWTAGEDETLTISGDQTVGQRLVLFITNDATSRTITFSTGFATTPDLVGIASQTAALMFVSNGTSFRQVSRAFSVQDFVALYPSSDARNVVQPAAATVKALVLKGASSQSDNLLEAQNSSGSTGARITSAMEFSNNGPATGSATNEIFGNGAGTALASGALYNTAVGNGALATVTTNDGNVAVGYQAGNLTTGSYNVHIGFQARHSTASDDYGVAIGSEARCSGNGVSIGRQANSSGTEGICIGYLAAAGDDCLSLGYNCITSNTSIAIGYSNGNGAGNQALFGKELSGDGAGSFCFGYKSTDTFLSWCRDTSGVGSGTARFQMRMTPTWSVSTEGAQLGKVTFGVSDAGTERVGITLTAVTNGCTTTVSSALLGTNVLNVTTTATNDDPNYQVRQNRVATTDATVTTLETVAITASKTYLIEARVVARRIGGTSGTADDGAVYIRRAMVTTKAGTVTINAVQDGLTQEDQAGWDCTLDVSGTNVRVRVTGAADNSVTWHSTTIIQDLGS